MKKERYAVIQLDTRNGWLMFCSSPEAKFSFSHNPLQMAVFEEWQADDLVRRYSRHLKETVPGVCGDYCISKIKLQ